MHVAGTGGKVRTWDEQFASRLFLEANYHTTVHFFGSHSRVIFKLRALTNRNELWLEGWNKFIIGWVFDAYLLVWIYCWVFCWSLALYYLLTYIAREALQNRVSVGIFPIILYLCVFFLLFSGLLWLIVKIAFLTFKFRWRRISKSPIIARLLSRYFTTHRNAPTLLTLWKFIVQFRLWCFFLFV